MLLYHVCYNNNMIKIVTCACGSSESLVRNFLHSINYPDWMSIPIVKGKEKSLNAISTLPNYPEVEILGNYLRNSSKWAVILGYNENGCRWADIAHSANKSRIDAELIVKTFA